MNSGSSKESEVTGVISYDTVSKAEIINPVESGLPGTFGFGDLGYDEIEILSSGEFQQRFLFSSGIELHVTFGGFSFKKIKGV